MATELQGNYSSAESNPKETEEELANEFEKGFFLWDTSKERLEQKVGKLMLSRVGTIITHKAGLKKVRLIHDLRRSLVNALATIPERVVLPRILDAVYSIIAAANAIENEEDVWIMVLDFKDAFKHLIVCEEERKYMAGQAELNGEWGYFSYLVLLFGAMGGPLLWGRVAAWLMRATTAMFERNEVNPQCFVDDPLLAVRGSKKQRTRLAACAILLWTGLNFRMSWKKGSWAQEAKWIGATFKVVKDQSKVIGVDVSIEQDKIDRIKSNVCDLLAQSMVEREKVREFAGLCTWAASVVPALRPYAQMMWAAAFAPSAGRETRKRCSRQRISLPLRWISALVQDASTFLRHVPSAGYTFTWILTFDASLEGGGATLHKEGSDKFDYYLISKWTGQDRKSLGANEGDPAFQAHWEAYALLVALWTWKSTLAVTGARLTVRGDAKGVLQDVIAQRARNPGINLIIAEMQLAVAFSSLDLTAVHWWSEDNEVCDKLSRGKVTQCLQQCRETSAARRTPWKMLAEQV